MPLQQKWLVFSLSPWRTPVDSIKDYFGEKVGLYFLFLGHYVITTLFLQFFRDNRRIV